MDITEQVKQLLSDKEIQEHISIIASDKSDTVYVCVCDSKTVWLNKLSITPTPISMCDSGIELTKTGKELLGLYCYKDGSIEYLTIDGRLGAHCDKEPFDKKEPKHTKLLMHFLDSYLDSYFRRKNDEN
jgi:hypothetical protein